MGCLHFDMSSVFFERELHYVLLERNLRFFLLIPLLIASGVHGDSDNDTGDVTNTNDVGVEAIFSPSVSATCRAGLMTIKVETNNNFQGAVHARDFRRPACTNYG